MVDIDDDPVLADFEGLAEGRDLEAGLDGAMGSLEVELQQFVVGIVADAAVAGGHAVERRIVVEHQDAVFGHLEVQFHDIDPHADDGFNGRDGILRIVAPVAAVRDNDNVFRIRIMQGGDNLFRPVGGRLVFGTASQQGKDGQGQKG